VENAYRGVAWWQDWDLRFAKYVTHDYRRIVGHEKISPNNSENWSIKLVGLKETLKSDLTEAIRSSDKLVSGTIRMVLTAITNEEVSGKEARVLSDAEIITVLSREAKKRREASDEFAKAGREDKAAEERAEGEVIARYLPEQMSEDDVKKLVAAAIASTGAAGPADMGKVMGVLKPQVAGKADGGMVSTLVKAALAALGEGN
jgi:uncharacterized protein YqeY